MEKSGLLIVHGGYVGDRKRCNNCTNCGKLGLNDEEDDNADGVEPLLPTGFNFEKPVLEDSNEVQPMPATGIEFENN
jgi:hypothetical protein